MRAGTRPQPRSSPRLSTDVVGGHRRALARANVPGMDARLRRAAAAQGEVFTRVQCYAVGLDDHDLARLLGDRGPWVVVRRGAYVERETWARASRAERLAMRDRAAHLLMETQHLMSHDSAARALGIPMLWPRRELVHVTRPGVGGSRTKSGVKHHLTRIELPETVTVGCLEVTGPGRTALDLAREHGLEPGVVAMDHVLGRGVRRSTVERDLQEMWSWPHVRTARAALDLADGRAESPAETVGRLLLLEMGLDVDVQWPVSCGGTVFWTDLRVGCHIIEIEGVGKLVPVGEGGLATRPTRELLRARENRQRLIRAEGLGLSFVGWDDCFGARRAHTRQWLHVEIALTEERYGAQLPVHLAERAALIRRRSPRHRPA